MTEEKENGEVSTESWSNNVLAPDPQHEKDFQVANNKFAFSPGQLNKLFNPKSLDAFSALGGLRGLEYGLQTDLESGLPASESTLAGSVTFEEARQVALSDKATGESSHSHSSSVPDGPGYAPNASSAKDTFTDRTRVFGTNDLPAVPKKNLLRLLWDAYNDKIMILLTIAAVVSLALGVYEAAAGQSQVDWIEGVAVCVAIAIVVAVTAGNDWQKQRSFDKLNKRVLSLALEKDLSC